MQYVTHINVTVHQSTKMTISYRLTRQTANYKSFQNDGLWKSLTFIKLKNLPTPPQLPEDMKKTKWTWLNLCSRANIQFGGNYMYLAVSSVICNKAKVMNSAHVAVNDLSHYSILVRKNTCVRAYYLYYSYTPFLWLSQLYVIISPQCCKFVS